MIVRRRVVVEGRVQGVFFRAKAAEEARRRGVGGYIKNLADGRVEAAFEGPREAVEAVVDWCRQGPSLARVEHVETSEEQPLGETRFVVR